MKKYFIILALVALSPSVAFASWWNPFTWFTSQEVIKPISGIITTATTSDQSSTTTTTIATSSIFSDVQEMESVAAKIPSSKSSSTSETKPINQKVKTQIQSSNVIGTSSKSEVSTFTCPAGYTCAPTTSNQTNNVSTSTTPCDEGGPCANPVEAVQIMYQAEANKISENPYTIEKQDVLNYFNNPSSATWANLPQDIQTALNVEGICNPSSQQICGYDIITTLILPELNQEIQSYNFQYEQLWQTEINNYSMENGLPVTQQVPTETTCDTNSSQNLSASNKSISGNGTVNCYTQ